MARLLAFLSLLLFIGCEQDSSPAIDDDSPLAEVERMLAQKQEEKRKQKKVMTAERKSEPGFRQEKSVLGTWPPKLNHYYPDLKLLDRRGRIRQLSDFKGRVLLIEPIGMNCPACQAFSGGNNVGGFKGTKPQKNLPSIDKSLKRFGKVVLSHPDLMLVQIVFFNHEMKTPTKKDLRDWFDHFPTVRLGYTEVLGASSDLAKRSKHMIPGFQLVDKDFVLRYDSTGHNPRHNLYKQLLPNVKRFMRLKK